MKLYEKDWILIIVTVIKVNMKYIFDIDAKLITDTQTKFALVHRN